jgi:signal peptidase I
MQFLALGMLVYFLGLLGWRLVDPKARALHALRHEARELIGELERIHQRLPGKIAPEVSERLAEQAMRVEAASLAGDGSRLEQETKTLDTLATQQLGVYRKQSGWDFASGFVKALAIAVIIRVFIIEPYRIPSGSMLPTLEIGDQVFVNKFVYGVRIPFINVVPFQIIRPPARGDVIVFNNPVNTDVDFIKRVVGIPGDRVEIIDETVFINGVEHGRRLVSGDFIVHNQDQRTGQWEDEEVRLYEESLGGVPHAVLQGPGRAVEFHAPFVVPDKHVFVLGDNRDNSSDSRFGFGTTGQVEYVPFGHIKGKAMVVWLSLGYGGLLSSFFDGTGLRLDRFFEPVR